MSWEKSIEARVVEGLGQLGKDRWPSEAVRFWQLGVMMDERPRSEAIIAIRLAGRTRGVTSPRAHVAFLMCLLRTSLPGVRANRLWPDVAELLYGLSEDWRSTSQCAEFFRECLRQVFRKRLNADHDHNKYVKLLLDEAGVGHDRARIIEEFLLDLVRSATGLSVAHDRVSEAVVTHVHDYLRKQARHDVAVLELVLIHAGTALVRVKQALLQEHSPLEVSAWTWNELSAFAESVVGEKLERVIPEAKAVFEALLPSLSSVISCAKALELLQQAPANISFPPRHDSSSRPKSVEDVPLGIVKIRHGSLLKHAETVDAHGYTSSSMLDLERDKWSLRRGGKLAAIRRNAPFWIERTRSGREPGRQLFGKNDTPQGFGWSGLTWPGDGIVCRSKDRTAADITLDRSTMIVPIGEWRWDSRGYSCRIAGVAYYDATSDQRVTVTSAGEPLFAAHVREGNGYLTNADHSFRVVASSVAFAGLSISLQTPTQALASAMLRLPREPFAIVNDHVYGLERLERDPAKVGFVSRVVLVGSADIDPPEPSTGELKSLPSLQVRPGQFAYEWTFPGQHALPEFRWAGRTWAAAQSSASLTVEGRRSVDIGACTVSGSGGIWPVRLSDMQGLRFRVSEVAREKSAALVLDTGLANVRLPLATAAQEITLHSLLESWSAAASRQFGPLAIVRLEVDRQQVGVSHAVFFVPDVIRQEPTSPGERPRLQFCYDSGYQMTVESDEGFTSTDSVAMAVWTFPAHDDLTPGSGVTFTWRPEVYEIHLMSDTIEVAVAETLTYRTLETLNVSLTGDLAHWILVLQEREATRTLQEINTSPGSDVAEAIRHAIRDTLNGVVDEAPPLMLAARYRQRVAASWPVDLSPSIVQLTAVATPAENSVEIKADVSWLSFPDWPISLRVRSGSTIIAVTESVIGTAADGDFTMRANLAVSIPSAFSALSSGSDTLCVEAVVLGSAIGSTPIGLPEIDVRPEEVPLQIRRLIESQQPDATRPAVCRLIAVLFFEHHQKTGRVPVDGERLAQKIESRFRNVDCVGRASACIRTLSHLHANAGLPQVRPIVAKEATRFGLVVNNVCLQALERDAQLGTMNPVEVQSLAAVLAQQVESAGRWSGSFATLLSRCKGLQER